MKHLLKEDFFTVPEIEYNGDRYTNNDEDAIPFVITVNENIIYGDYGTAHDENTEIVNIPPNKRMIYGRVFYTEDNNYIIVLSSYKDDICLKLKHITYVKQIVNDLSLPIEQVYYYIDNKYFQHNLLKLYGTKNIISQTTHNKLAYRDKENNIRTDKVPMTLAQYHNLIYQENKIIMKCVDKCLRKYLKENVNCKQSLSETKHTKTTDQKFEKWKKQYDTYLNEMVNELQTDYLNQLGLTIRINYGYVFNGGKSRWLAVYERRSQQILNSIISIGINYPLLYSEMCKRHIDKDRFNIEAQARITVGHEIGHGLVDYIKNIDIEPTTLEGLPNVTIIKKCRGRKEETLVEEFGESQFPEATYTWDSKLADALEELQSIK